MSPGVQKKCHIVYASGKGGNYIKFGDASTEGTEFGIREAYLTHNPDIGIFAIFRSDAFVKPRLGTLLARYIKDECHIDPFGTTAEWFSIETGAAWSLATAMAALNKAHTESMPGQEQLLTK